MQSASLFSVLCCFSLVWATAVSAFAEGRSEDALLETIAANRAAVVTVWGRKDDSDATVQSSGCIVDARGYVLTTAHQVQGVQKIEIELNNGQRFPVEVAALLPERELALLQTANPLPHPAIIGDATALVEGAAVFAIAAPLELSQSVVRGTISSTRRTLRDFPVYQSDLRAAPGSSGGPVFDQHGNLVALIIGKFEQEDWITILNPINNAYPLLARFGIYVPPRTDPSTEELMPANGLTLRQAKAIEAYNLGVRSNDVMTKRDAYRKATDLLPEFFEAWFNLGVVLTRLGDYAGACNAYERALALQPSSPQALRNYGRLKLLLRDYEAASAAFEKVLDLRPDDPQTYNDCGEAYRRQGKIQRAIEYFEKATTLNPKYAPAYYNLGACFVELQRYTEAVRALENYLRVAEDADDKVQVRRWIEDLQGKTKASP